MLSNDGKQMLTGASIFMLEFYKILCGCFLILFVPQDCGNNQICSISDNYHTRNSINKAGLSFNLISFVLFFSLYIIEIQREKYCIDKLDIDPDKPNNNLDDEIEDYPILKKTLKNLNKKYYHLTFVNLFIQFINIILSTYIFFKGSGNSERLKILLERQDNLQKNIIDIIENNINNKTDINFALSTKAPTIKAGVIIANVI